MPQPADTPAEGQREIVSFQIAGQRFCVDIGYVREIRGWSPTTVLPHAPEFVKGMMNLRGTVLPVVDLAQRLGLGPTEPNDRHVIIITILDDKTVGLLVEAVSDILTMTKDTLKPTPDVASSETREFIEGIFTMGSEMIRAIDIRRILKTAEGVAG